MVTVNQIQAGCFTSIRKMFVFTGLMVDVSIDEFFFGEKGNELV